MKYYTLLILITISFWLFSGNSLSAQAVPAEEENIPFLVTFGAHSETSWGDDDFSQTFFFVIPEDNITPIYIRVFDPDTGGAYDEQKGDWNTHTRFSVYGGSGCISHPDATGTDPVGNYKSGNLLASKVFGVSEKYDNSWYTFGPFNPTEGELVPKYGGYVFKVIADGITGDDGNLYRYFMSSSSDANVPIEGGNAFTYEYTFRLHDDPTQVSHIYPFIDDKVISIKQSNFDWDNDGVIRIVSKAKPGLEIEVSGDNEWKSSEHKIVDREHNSSLDIQFIKSKNRIQNNNVVISVRNQYGEFLPFYTVPIGGIPKYQPTINVVKR
jgi:hypothetical protein